MSDLVRGVIGALVVTALVLGAPIVVILHWS
jgi:hypothetical protein